MPRSYWIVTSWTPAITTIVASPFAHLLQSTCKQAGIGRVPVRLIRARTPAKYCRSASGKFSKTMSNASWNLNGALTYCSPKELPFQNSTFQTPKNPSYMNHINLTMKNHTYKQTTKKMQTINNKQLNIQHCACPCKSLLPSIGFQTVPNNREVWDQGVGNILVHRNASKRGRCMEMKEWTKKKQAFSVSVFSFNRFQRCRSRMWGLQTLNLMNLSPKRWSASLAVPVPVALRINVGSGRNPRSQDANNNVVMPNESL